jgi:hypothetical protein
VSQRKDRLIRKLNETRDTSLAFFQSLSREQWQTPVYEGPPVWTARDILAHYVSAERSLILLFEDVQKGGPGAPEDFDLDEFNNREVAEMETISIEDLYEQFAGGRAQTLAFVESLDDSDLDKQGRHPFLGIASLEDILKLLYRNSLLHERDMTRVLYD